MPWGQKRACARFFGGGGRYAWEGPDPFRAVVSVYGVLHPLRCRSATYMTV